MYDGLVSNSTGWLLGLIGVAGLVLNGVLIIILIHLRQHGDKRGLLSLRLVALISLMDIMSCICGIYLTVARVVWDAPEMFDKPGFCSGIGFASLFSVGMSGVLVGSLGVERYLAICKQRHISVGALVLCVGTVLSAQICLLSSAAYKGGLVRDATFSYCVISSDTAFRVHYWCFNIIFLSPILVLTFCYTAIFIKCLTLDRPTEHFSSHCLSLRALLFLIVYHGCYGPTLIFSLWGAFGSRDSRPISLNAFGALGVALTVAINPILVLFLDRDIRATAYSHLRGQECTQSHIP